VLLFFVVVVVSGAPSAVQVSSTSTTVSISNHYVSATLDKSAQSLDFGSDFLGGANYTSVLASPLVLEVRSSRVCVPSSPPSISWTSSSHRSDEDDEETTTVTFTGLVDCVSAPLISSTWNVSMSPSSRSIAVSLAGRAVSSAPISAVSYGMYFTAPSIYGLFSEWSDATLSLVPSGISQMMSNTGNCLSTSVPLPRLYSLGGGTAVDVLFDDALDNSVVLLSQGQGFGSGVQRIVRGKYTGGDSSRRMADAWVECWPETGDGDSEVLAEGDEWTLTLKVVPNDYDFPAYPVVDIAAQPQIPFKDLRTFLTGIYGSPVGCMQGYYEAQQGTIAPTLATPTVGYSPDTNFFDPDSKLTLGRQSPPFPSHHTLSERKEIDLA
jgi:hypothetical protein